MQHQPKRDEGALLKDSEREFTSQDTFPHLVFALDNESLKMNRLLWLLSTEISEMTGFISTKIDTMLFPPFN